MSGSSLPEHPGGERLVGIPLFEPKGPREPV